MTNDDTFLRDESEALVNNLFYTAQDRLAKRRIKLEYDSTAVKWVLDRTEWKQSINPLCTLDGNWHTEISTRIETLLLENKLQCGDTIRICIDNTVDPPRLDIVVIEI